MLLAPRGGRSARMWMRTARRRPQRPHAVRKDAWGVEALERRTLLAVTPQSVTPLALNQPPVNHVPPQQVVPFGQPLVFSSAEGNAITITDANARTFPESVTLELGAGVAALTLAQ